MWAGWAERSVEGREGGRTSQIRMNRRRMMTASANCSIVPPVEAVYSVDSQSVAVSLLTQQALAKG